MFWRYLELIPPSAALPPTHLTPVIPGSSQTAPPHWARPLMLSVPVTRPHAGQVKKFSVCSESAPQREHFRVIWCRRILSVEGITNSITVGAGNSTPDGTSCSVGATTVCSRGCPRNDSRVIGSRRTASSTALTPEPFVIPLDWSRRS